MPRLAANLTMLFIELPFTDCFAAASSAGFADVEFLFPYDHDSDTIGHLLAVNDLSLVLHNLPAGNWAAGERGIACHPDRIAEFRDGVTRAIAYATALGCPRRNCLAGIRPAGVAFEPARETLSNNLLFAADQLASAGLQLLIEPVNTFDVPGFFVPTTAFALSLLDQVGSANLKLQFDIPRPDHGGAGLDWVTPYLPHELAA